MKQLFMMMGVIFVTGCTGMDVKDYKDTSPTLKIEEYFQGETRAWGVFQDRFGKVRRQFYVDINGTWDEEKRSLKLVEDFTYSDSSKEQRIWNIRKNDNNQYTGEAENVIGIAKGESAGNAFRFQYKFNLSVEDDTWKVSFDDWMFLQPDGVTLFNKATIKRWGVRLGDVYIFFRKENADASLSAAGTSLDEAEKSAYERQAAE